jgi:peptidoglycan/LPS O-acetylase OafA/YrhL
VKNPSPSLRHIPALDGVRGVGVLGILLFHAGHLRGGWLGVDLFFVLSGFLITSLLLAEFESRGRISLPSFWLRRARRLLPALFLTLLGVAAYAATLADPRDLERIRAEGLATLFYVANWHGIAAGHDYWELFRSPSPLDHTWSLAIEEQFYLLWPPIAWLVLSRARTPLRTLAYVASFFGLLSAVWMAFLFDPLEGTARVYFGTDTRIGAPLVGSALAAMLRPMLRDAPVKSSRAADLLALCAAGILAWAWLFASGSDAPLYRGGLLLLAVLAGVLITGVVAAPRGVAARLLAAAPLRWLGVISYGLYLWHWPIYLVLTPERTALDGPWLTLLRFAASVLVACGSYFLVEKPIRSRQISVWKIGVGGVAAIALVVSSLLASTAVSRRAAPEEPAPLASALETQGRLDILLIGDSVAESLGSEFVARARLRGLRGRVLGALGCLVLDTDAARFPDGSVLPLTFCDAVRKTWRRVGSEDSPEVVLIVEAAAGPGDRLIDGSWHHPCTPAYDQAFARDLADTIRYFTGIGARTAVIVPIPWVKGRDPSLHPWSQGLDSEALDLLMVQRTECQNDLRREGARRTGALVIELSDLVCPGGQCLQRIDGTELRPDGVHFKGEGARLVSDWLLDELSRHGSLGRESPRKGSRRSVGTASGETPPSSQTGQ